MHKHIIGYKMKKKQIQTPHLTKLEKQIISFLMKDRGLSRYDISKHLKGNAGTISRTVSKLVEKKYLVENIEKTSFVGRPRLALELNHTIGYIIGLDLEATNVRGVVIDFGLKIITQKRYPLQLGCNKATVLKAICKMYKSLSAGVDGNRILGVGLGIPAPCNAETGEIISYSENLLWSNFPVKKMLERKIDKPIFTEHNVFTIAMGEKWFGFHEKVDNLISILVRPAVACALILNGYIYRIGSNTGMNIAHMKIYSNGEICECGRKGCLRIYASGRAILKKMKEMNLATNENDITLLTLAEMTNKGEKHAVEIIEKAGQSLGIALSHIINTLGIGQVVINSDLNTAGKIFLSPIESEIRNAVPETYIVPRVMFSTLNGYAGSLGSAIIALQKVCDVN